MPFLYDFRASAPYVTDPANASPVLGSEIFPHTFSNGGSAGWDASVAAGARDRDNTLDPRVAGVNARPNDGTQSTFTHTHASPGTYPIGLALGDTGFQGYLYAEIWDGTTLLATLNESSGNNPPITNFYDATGTAYASAAWPGSNTPVSFPFASTTLKIVIGSPTAQVNATAIAHLFVGDIVGGGSAPASDDAYFPMAAPSPGPNLLYY